MLALHSLLCRGFPFGVHPLFVFSGIILHLGVLLEYYAPLGML